MVIGLVDGAIHAIGIDFAIMYKYQGVVYGRGAPRAPAPDLDCRAGCIAAGFRHGRCRHSPPPRLRVRFVAMRGDWRANIPTTAPRLQAARSRTAMRPGFQCVEQWCAATWRCSSRWGINFHRQSHRTYGFLGAQFDVRFAGWGVGDTYQKTSYRPPEKEPSFWREIGYSDIVFSEEIRQARQAVFRPAFAVPPDVERLPSSRKSDPVSQASPRESEGGSHKIQPTSPRTTPSPSSAIAPGAPRSAQSTGSFAAKCAAEKSYSGRRGGRRGEPWRSARGWRPSRDWSDYRGAENEGADRKHPVTAPEPIPADAPASDSPTVTDIEPVAKPASAPSQEVREFEPTPAETPRSTSHLRPRSRKLEHASVRDRSVISPSPRPIPPNWK